jgi:hypothetical protein
MNVILQGPTNEELGHIVGIVTSTGGFPYLQGVFLRPNGTGPLRLGDCQIDDGKAQWEAAIEVINEYAGLNRKKMHMESGTPYPSQRGGFQDRWLCCSQKRTVGTRGIEEILWVILTFTSFLPHPPCRGSQDVTSG